MTSCLTVVPSYATPTVDIDCGQLQILEDDDGRYLLFNPTGTVRFYGNKVNYIVYYTTKKKTPLSEQSRLKRLTTFSGSSKNQIDNLNIELKFGENEIGGKYFNARYLEFAIYVKVPGEKTHSYRCIYKR